MSKFDEQYAAQGGRCWICQRFTLPQNLTRDHIVPKWRGGKATWDNLLLAHARCNEARRGLTIGSLRFERWYRGVLRGYIYPFIRREVFVNPSPT